MENTTQLPSEDTTQFPLKRPAKSHKLALIMVVLVILLLPLAVIAARMTTNLSSKAYVPTKPKPLCVGAVENISYESACNLSIPVPTPATNCVSWFDGCNTCGVKNGVVSGCTKMACKGSQQAPRCLRTSTTPKIMNDQSGIIERTDINGPSTRPEPTICTQDASTCPDGTQVGRTGPKCEFVCNPSESTPSATIGYKNATVICTGGYTQSIDLRTDDSSYCFSTKEITLMAEKICSQHPVCSKPTPTLTPTPTPVQTCSAIQKHAFESPCRMPVADDPKIQEGSNIRVQSTYTYINFTCADGYYERFRFKSCTTTESLLRQAEDTCRNHLVIKPTFGNKCLIPINRPSVQGYPSILPSETPKKGQMGFDSIKFSCPDGFVSSYEPKTCTTSASLNTYANKVCLSHLSCSQLTPTPTAPKNSAPVITTTSLDTGTVGKSYNSSITATDVDLGDALTMTISGLPSGLRQGPCAVPVTGKTITCYLSGTPAGVGIFKIYVKVTDKLDASTSKIFPLTVVTTKPTPTISKNTPPIVTTTSLASGIVGKTYSATISAKDINPSDNLYMSISGLPFGVYQGPCTETANTTQNGVIAPGAYISCTISGTTIRPGSYTLTAKVQDDKGGTSSKSMILTIMYDRPRPL